MDVLKKRIQTRIEEIKHGRDNQQQEKLTGLEEALNIIEQYERDQPREAWGDY